MTEGIATSLKTLRSAVSGAKIYETITGWIIFYTWIVRRRSTCLEWPKVNDGWRVFFNNQWGDGFRYWRAVSKTTWRPLGLIDFRTSLQATMFALLEVGVLKIIKIYIKWLTLIVLDGIRARTKVEDYQNFNMASGKCRQISRYLAWLQSK